MAKIVILEKDSLSRQAIQNALEAEGLMQACSFTEEAGGASLWIGAEGESVPQNLKILENDRFSKPLRIGALLDRVQHHLSSASRPVAEVLNIGPYQLDTGNNDLRHKNGKSMRLTEKESRILECLSRSKNKIVDRRALLDEVWGYAESVETHTLETHIYRLRQKIETDPAQPEILLTEEQGYKLKI